METLTTISEVSINYKPNRAVMDAPKIITSKDAEMLFKSVWSEQAEYLEEVYLMLLNRANRVIGYLLLSKGGTAGTVVDSKVIFQAALKANAQSIIIAHNHPSGNLKPSNEDIGLTKKIKEAGKLMEINLLDHIIITADSYYSFADEGMM